MICNRKTANPLNKKKKFPPYTDMNQYQKIPPQTMYPHPSHQIVSHLTFRGVTRERACVCAYKRACSPYFPNDLSGCSGAISGSASRTGDCRPSLFKPCIHTVTQFAFRKSQGLSTPPSTGKCNYRELCLFPHPYPPCSSSSSSPLPPSGCLLL